MPLILKSEGLLNIFGRRDCEGCHLCCELWRIPELDKPAETPCVNQDPEGCAAYNRQRPDCCGGFDCRTAPLDTQVALIRYGQRSGKLSEAEAGRLIQGLPDLFRARKFTSL